MLPQEMLREMDRHRGAIRTACMTPLQRPQIDELLQLAQLIGRTELHVVIQPTIKGLLAHSENSSNLHLSATDSRELAALCYVTRQGNLARFVRNLAILRRASSRVPYFEQTDSALLVSFVSSFTSDHATNNKR